MTHFEVKVEVRNEQTERGRIGRVGLSASRRAAEVDVARRGDIREFGTLQPLSQSFEELDLKNESRQLSPTFLLQWGLKGGRTFFDSPAERLPSPTASLPRMSGQQARSIVMTGQANVLRLLDSESV